VTARMVAPREKLMSPKPFALADAAATCVAFCTQIENRSTSVLENEIRLPLPR
jgi:hypothetical protein